MELIKYVIDILKIMLISACIVTTSNCTDDDLITIIDYEDDDLITIIEFEDDLITIIDYP